jgi:hypothetical protein
MGLSVLLKRRGACSRAAAFGLLGLWRFYTTGGALAHGFICIGPR